MIKLTSAKCPSCGADIKVNEKLENTICQYCGTMVLVSDAIQKHKVELSGEVKVSGIRGSKDILDEAKKELKIHNYNGAIDTCDEILEKDKFNTEASSLRLKAQLDKINSNNSFEIDLEKCDENLWYEAERLIRYYYKLNDVIVANDLDGYKYDNFSNDEIEEIKRIEKFINDHPNYLEEIRKWKDTISDFVNFVISNDIYIARDYISRLLTSKIKTDELIGHEMFTNLLDSIIPIEGVYCVFINDKFIPLEQKYNSITEINEKFQDALKKMKQEYYYGEELARKIRRFLISYDNKKNKRTRKIEEKLGLEKGKIIVDIDLDFFHYINSYGYCKYMHPLCNGDNFIKFPAKIDLKEIDQFIEYEEKRTKSIQFILKVLLFFLIFIILVSCFY